eukprot:6181531-Amphidinium_carterae.1
MERSLSSLPPSSAASLSDRKATMPGGPGQAETVEMRACSQRGHLHPQVQLCSDNFQPRGNQKWKTRNKSSVPPMLVALPIFVSSSCSNGFVFQWFEGY